MKITKTAKKELTFAEERQRILENLIRMRKLNMFKYNHVTEYYDKKFINICGIDKTGGSKLFFTSEYMNNDLLRTGLNDLCCEECKCRNYAVIIKAIKEFIGINNIVKYMSYEKFMLTVKEHNLLWDEEYWTHQSSVDICHKVLNIIKKKMILDKLEKRNET